MLCKNLLVDALKLYFETNVELSEDETYFCFDMVVNNQWEANEHDFDWWSNTFKSAIQSMGRCVMVLVYLLLSSLWGPPGPPQKGRAS